MNKKEEKKDKVEEKDKKNEDKKKALIKLRVFEEDDFFEEFEEGKYYFLIKLLNIDKLRLERIKSEEMRQWQANWEDEEINDNFENILKQELNAHGEKLTS